MPTDDDKSQLASRAQYTKLDTQELYSEAVCGSPLLLTLAAAGWCRHSNIDQATNHIARALGLCAALRSLPGAVASKQTNLPLPADVLQQQGQYWCRRKCVFVAIVQCACRLEARRSSHFTERRYPRSCLVVGLCCKSAFGAGCCAAIAGARCCAFFSSSSFTCSTFSRSTAEDQLGQQIGSN